MTLRLEPPYTPAIIDEVDVVEAVSETVDLGSLPVRLSVNTLITSSANEQEFIDGVLAEGTITVTDYAAAHLTAATGTVVVVDYTALTEETATPSGTITYGTPDPGDTVIFTDLPTDGTVTFTCVAATPGADEFSSIAELTALIDGLDDLSASDNGTAITLVVDTAGAAMNDATVTGTGTFVALSVTFSGGQDHATLTIDGTPLVEGTDFDAETSNTVTGDNIVAALPVTVTGINTAGSIAITAATEGAAGNSIGLVTTDAVNLTVSGATLTGGIDAAVVTVDGTALVESTDWDAETSNDVTADNLAAAIDALADVTAANPAAAIITVKAATIGTAGNAIDTTVAGDGVTAEQATLEGGLDTAVDGVEFTITIPDHGYTTGLKVNYDVDAGTTLDNLVDNTDYWVIKVDDNTIALAASEADAGNDVRIEIADADDAVGGGEFSLTPTAVDVDVTVSASNDGENFVELDSDTLTDSGALLYQYPTISVRFLKVEVEPNDSEVDVKVTLHTKL